MFDVAGIEIRFNRNTWLEMNVPKVESLLFFIDFWRHLEEKETVTA